MDNQNDQPNLRTLLRVDEMPEEQREIFLEEVGTVVIDSSVGRLLLTLEEAEVEKLQETLANLPEDQDIFAYLLTNYSNFEKIVEEEMNAFYKEAKRIVD
jgi:hypothetical protein